MPMLGDLLAAARDGAGNFQSWLKVANPELAAAVEAAAGAAGMTPTSYVRAAISDFARFAREEDWATLTSTLKRSEDPGTACLLAMVDWRLTARACANHSHHHFPEGGAVDERSHPRSA
jgi:hypothetical protein